MKSQRILAGAIAHIAVAAIAFVIAMPIAAETPATATAAYNAYAEGVEARLAKQHAGQADYLAHEDWARIRNGEVLVEEITPTGGKDVEGGLLHHWRGTAYVHGASSADFEHTLKDFAQYPHLFAPEVLRTNVTVNEGDHSVVTMRAEQKHVITVVMDQTFDNRFGQLDAAHGYSLSRSQHIAEIAEAGTAQEHALSPSEEHGFLWRQNSYWSYEEGDGGLYIQIESISLSRTIPSGLGWVVRPFVEGIPRDSLEFMLRSMCNSLRR